jgi:hypothetical protein
MKEYAKNTQHSVNISGCFVSLITVVNEGDKNHDSAMKCSLMWEQQLYKARI